MELKYGVDPGKNIHQNKRTRIFAHQYKPNERHTKHHKEIWNKETSCALSKQKAPILCNALQPNCDLKCLKHNLINCLMHKQETRQIFPSWCLKLNRISAAGQQLQRTKHWAAVSRRKKKKKARTLRRFSVIWDRSQGGVKGLSWNAPAYQHAHAGASVALSLCA